MEKRLIFFSGPEAFEPERQILTEHPAEVQNVNTEALQQQRTEQLAAVHDTERQNRQQEESQQSEIVQKIETQLSPELLDAISRVEVAYRELAIRWSANAESMDTTIADAAMKPVRKEWNKLRRGPARTAIEDAVSAALRRATETTPNVQFHATGSESLVIGSSRVSDPTEELVQANDTQQETPPSGLQKFFDYLHRLFNRVAMEKIGTPAVDRYNGESALTTARILPGTQWSGPKIEGAYNLEFTFKAPLSQKLRDQFLDLVMDASDGKNGATGNNDGIVIQSLLPLQIAKTLQVAHRWEEALSEATRATDALQGIPLLDRNAVLMSYQKLETDAQKTYFRSIMSKASLETQAPTARVLAFLSPRMTQDLADGGPLHKPDISDFQNEFNRMSRVEKDAMEKLPIGEIARALYFADKQ